MGILSLSMATWTSNIATKMRSAQPNSYPTLPSTNNRTNPTPQAPTPLSNESSCQIIDFAPGTTSPMQRLTTHLDHCAVVIEGVFRIILDSGEERTMQRGDMAVHHSTAHRWVNVTGNGSLPARILLVPLHSNDAPPAAAAAEKMWRRLALPRRDSLCVPRSSHRIEDGLDRGRVAKFREDDWWDSEF